MECLCGSQRSFGVSALADHCIAGMPARSTLECRITEMSGHYIHVREPESRSDSIIVYVRARCIGSLLFSENHTQKRDLEFHEFNAGCRRITNEFSRAVTVRYDMAG